MILGIALIGAIAFQFTHPGRGATIWTNDITHRITVSIHAPREGCDLSKTNLQKSANVSIHAPREGCDTTQAHL